MFNYFKKQKDTQEYQKLKIVQKVTNGAFGGAKRFLGDYETLKVIPRSKRTNENSNTNGVALVNEFKINNEV